MLEPNVALPVCQVPVNAVKYYDMENSEDIWKVCAMCRHFDAVDGGLAIEGMADTEYGVFMCRKLDVERREDYALAPVEKDLENPRPNKCPFWEPWQNRADIGTLEIKSYTQEDIEAILDDLSGDDEQEP
ncbi:MAG: hypothetical protein K6G50_13390 [bacterium]|nr:hypothetical protein [bacterium]